ncbi:MAG: MBL fold metallo-hydrolase [Spirochaetes bacterium]|nr:MAG: MBL fold metallo-hydrolase [Spirochaetota bacterium]
MKIKFWGVRGSIPTPVTKTQLQNKIAAAVQRIKHDDLISQETREAFLANLPRYIMGTVGGNTTCVEVRLKDNTVCIFDCGSGIREMAHSMKENGDGIKEFHIFFTHFHWDHIQGLPFFTPHAYDPKCKINFYSPVENFSELLKGQMQPPYFPVSMDVMNADINYHVLKVEPLILGSAEIRWREMKHPGKSYAYQLTEFGNKTIFSTDTELTEKDFHRNDENRLFFEDADLLIMDSQYTLGEAIEKYDWGHSSYSIAVDFAVEWNIKKLVLFHHDPFYDDKKMFNILKSSQWYLKHLEKKDLEIYLAIEDMELEV